jgi:hypothetical protein
VGPAPARWRRAAIPSSRRPPPQPGRELLLGCDKEVWKSLNRGERQVFAGRWRVDWAGPACDEPVMLVAHRRRGPKLC